MSLEEYITPFERKRNLPMIYDFDRTKQLIFKNNIIPDGVTIIGTQESIELFLSAAAFDTSFELEAKGFYPFKNR